ncbi:MULTISPECIES: helix-turn-helix domain-containing protein [Streptococcus]|uniref:helix-turn-helix domain-containing protein n=1 Tax=Streptococcus TaxID=1301 RepID=UPI000673D69D|nr:MULTISPECIES: helix-turn-helix transcriptional regulator [Streptococcus]MCD3384862.1 helix-turn-helix transcriptional regulator [Streptococcus equi subsp. zooepidemicus]MCD3393240.1 helix-turn-helix transcriptional regulator [Streptococcus equi subsp. zooepidemicus]MCD3428957.1 helix-turn-helix transcriptional regulator [Streptococcus equi subsp. zooepidemicus]MCQ9216368.1 helix-turn-helix transcriptional regulator [Streptococcus gallolyticus]MDI6035355.1 helix-turn-helix transcriptional re
MIDNNRLTEFTISKIKELRLKNKFSQEQLSLKAELDPKYINKLENGRYKIRLDTLSKILDALQISYLDFFEVPKINENNIINELISELSILSEEEQTLKIRAIIQLLK